MFIHVGVTHICFRYSTHNVHFNLNLKYKRLFFSNHWICYLDQNKFTRTWDIQTYIQNLKFQLFYELELLSFSRWPVPKHDNCTVYINFLNLRYSGTNLNICRAFDIHKNRQDTVPNRCVHVRHAIRTVMTDWFLITWKSYAMGNLQLSMFAFKSVKY